MCRFMYEIKAWHQQNHKSLLRYYAILFRVYPVGLLATPEYRPPATSTTIYATITVCSHIQIYSIVCVFATLYGKLRHSHWICRFNNIVLRHIISFTTQSSSEAPIWIFAKSVCSSLIYERMLFESIVRAPLFGDN